MDAHRIVFERAHRGPQVGVLGRSPHCDLRFQIRPATGFDQTHHGNDQGARPDQDELQYFIEDGRAQSAQGDVNCHRDRRHPDAEVDVPAQHDLHYQRHRVHVDATHQHCHERKRDRGQRACRFSVTQLQVAGHRVGLGDVVERHHDQREKQHRRDCADPIPVRCQDSILIGRRRPPHEFERAQIGGQEAQAGNPGRHLAAGHEEVFARAGLAFQVPPNGQYEGKIERDNHHIHRGQVHQSLRGKHCHCLHHLWFLSFSRKMCAKPLSCTYTNTLEKASEFVNRVLSRVPQLVILGYVIMPAWS